MIYKGYKSRIRCIDWEQVNTIDNFWNTVTSNLDYEKIIGLGMNWSDDLKYIDYALGVIDDKETLGILKQIDFLKQDFV